MAKLFGTHSETFELWSTQLADFDIYTNAKGYLQLSKNKANKAMYRQLIAWAKREQKTPYSVLKRKADKERKQMENDDFFDFGDENEIIDKDTYDKWYDMCESYWSSCYAIAKAEGYEGKSAYERAGELYDDENEYISAWNRLYLSGAFKEWQTHYQEEQTNQQYETNTDTGEMTEKPDFFEDWTDIETD